MHFALSTLLATALLATLAAADVHHGQQTTFRLETRHVQQQKGKSINHHHHQKASSHKERRNLKQQATFDVPAVPITECQTEHCKRDNLHKTAVKNEDTELAFHRKISRKRKTRELGQSGKKIKKRDVTKSLGSKKMVEKEDTELAFHRKISRNRKTRELGQKKKKVAKRSVGKKGVGKRGVGKKGVGKKITKNEEAELAFHRRISRNRKMRELGQTKKEV